MSNPNSVNGGAVFAIPCFIHFNFSVLCHRIVEEDYDWCWCWFGFHFNHHNTSGKVLVAKKKGRLALDFQFQSKHYPPLTLKI